MGIFDALNTAVAGLQAQSFALQNISGNIANSSTVGYKGVNTFFETLVANSSAGDQQVAGSVTAGSQQTITTPGTISSSSVATNMAINGDGFFSVQSPSGTVDGQPVFSGATDYTREGDFQLDTNGNLVNGSGYYLMGVPVDPKTGNPLGNVASVLQFNNSFMPAQATTTIQYSANLPSTPQTTASSSAPSGSLLADGGLNTGDFGTNPLVAGTPAQPFGNNTVTGTAEGATITDSTALSSNGVGTIMGTAVDNQASTPAPITTATLLSGGAGTDSVSPSFASGETLLVNGDTISFYNSAGSTGPTSAGSAADTKYIDLASGTVGDLLSDIDSFTGTTNLSTVSSAGVITLNDSAGALSISSSDAAALNTLGFGDSGSAASATNAIATSFAAGDTITVDNQTIQFYDSNDPNGATSAGSTAGVKYVDLATATIGDLLGDIDSITGSTTVSSISSTGAITLNTGTTQKLTVTSSNTAAFGALGFSQNISQAMTGGGTAGTGVVVGSDVTAFDNESISGGAVTAYTASGTPVNIELRWVKTDSSSLGAGHQDTWNLFYQADPNATGSSTTDPAWVNVGTNFTFNSAGDLTSPTGADISIPSVTIDGQSLGNLSLNVGSSGLTQFATTSGAVTINTLNQDGYAAGQLNSIAINDSGLVVGTFSNGQNIDLAEVPLVHFNGTNFLQTLSGNAYAATTASGAAIAGASGTIDGSSLEGSNTDIADEFTKLIVTQQAYSANTKVITTANDMVQDLLNVLR
jgi:flagellar hook protein FlgE